MLSLAYNVVIWCEYNVADELPRYRNKDLSKIMREDAFPFFITHYPSLLAKSEKGAEFSPLFTTTSW